jgi:hypothetical protein
MLAGIHELLFLLIKHNYELKYHTNIHNIMAFNVSYPSPMIV